MMILAVIAILPLLAERIYNEEIDRNDRVQDADRQALSLARQAAAAQNELIVSVRAILQSVASARATFNASNEECGRFLSKIAVASPWIQTLSVANLQGRIICTSSPRALGLDISERPHFIKAVDSGDFVLSDYFVSARGHTPVVSAALAQTGANGAASAVVLAVLDLRWFSRVAQTFAPVSGAMLMIDGSGTVLARYPEPEKNPVGRNFKDAALVRSILGRPDGLVTESGLDGVRRIYGFVRMPGTEARFAVGFDESAVLTHANHEMWVALAELGAVIGLVLLGIWFGGERLLVQPIRTLAQTAVRIGRGELKTGAAALPWAAEFMPLAVALDDMSDKLEAREQELRDANSQLHELAHVDALTGLANRRTFNVQLASDWAAATKFRHPLAVLMIDVDHFKRFNDHYGHLQGDACLRKIADILKSGTRRKARAAQNSQADTPPPLKGAAGIIRKPDFTARYGGEEFVILLQGTSLDNAVLVGDRLRQAVEDMLMAHAGAPWGFVSISVGAAATVPAEDVTPQDLIECADAALYAAKQRGRNTVVAHSVVPLSKAG